MTVLRISELEEADSGDYRCYVRNYYGYSEDIVRLTVVREWQIVCYNEDRDKPPYEGGVQVWCPL